jgi:Elongation factor P (EF-P) KOW-like domain
MVVVAATSLLALARGQNANFLFPHTKTPTCVCSCPIAIYSYYISGLTLELDGEPYKVLSFSIMKQARGAAKTTIKFKNLMRGTTIENTYRSGEKFETAEIARTEAQFTYKEGVRGLLSAGIVYALVYVGVVYWQPVLSKGAELPPS